LYYKKYIGRLRKQKNRAFANGFSVLMGQKIIKQWFQVHNNDKYWKN